MLYTCMHNVGNSAHVNISFLEEIIFQGVKVNRVKGHFKAYLDH